MLFHFQGFQHISQYSNTVLPLTPAVVISFSGATMDLDATKLETTSPSVVCPCRYGACSTFYFAPYQSDTTLEWTLREAEVTPHTTAATVVQDPQVTHHLN